MSFSVQWSNLIAGGGDLGEAIFKNLQNWANRLNIWQAKEHDLLTGTHTDITPLSILCSGVGRFQRLGFDPANFTVFNLTVDGVITVDKPYSVVKVNALAAAFRIDGLFHDLYKQGDLVLLINATDDNGATGTDLTARFQSNAAPNAQFRGNPGVVNEDKTFKAGRMLLLMRDQNTGATATSGSRYWRACIL